MCIRNRCSVILPSGHTHGRHRPQGMQYLRLSCSCSHLNLIKPTVASCSCPSLERRVARAQASPIVRVSSDITNPHSSNSGVRFATTLFFLVAEDSRHHQVHAYQVFHCGFPVPPLRRRWNILLFEAYFSIPSYTFRYDAWNRRIITSGAHRDRGGRVSQRFGSFPYIQLPAAVLLPIYEFVSTDGCCPSPSSSSVLPMYSNCCCCILCRLPIGTWLQLALSPNYLRMYHTLHRSSSSTMRRIYDICCSTTTSSLVLSLTS